VKWTAEEDAILAETVRIHGVGNWSLAAHSLPLRNGKQCRERWINQLCPALSRDNWTPQEDAILTEKQRTCGNSWAQVAQSLPGRCANAVKNRWSWLIRHKACPDLPDEERMRQPPSIQPSEPKLPVKAEAPKSRIYEPAGFPPAEFPELMRLRFDNPDSRSQQNDRWRVFDDWIGF
jgi:hypothetical protein